jgi:crotonobetainyl-CoA:carnitine CoA-transferase CaiB-like acyl-CoA transferase
MFASKIMNGFGPLAGVKVVELADWVAGPAGVRMLGEFGAEIIKVENPKGDPQRTQCWGFGGKNT